MSSTGVTREADEWVGAIRSVPFTGAGAWVPAVAGHKIRVVGFDCRGTTAGGTIDIEDGSGGTVLARYNIGAGDGPSYGRFGGLFEASANTAIFGVQSGGGVVRGTVSYALIKA